MTAEEFVGTLSSLFGGEWKAAFAAGTGYSRAQIYRYETGISPIPLRVETFIETLATLRGFGVPLPQAFDGYPVIANPFEHLTPDQIEPG